MKVLCELSGGADSALAAIYAKKKYPGAEFFALWINYGQPYAKMEWAKAVTLNQKIFQRPGIKNFIESTWMGVPKTDGLYGSGVAPEMVSLRNLVITAMAASWAQALGAEVIVTGSKSLSKVETDPYSFRDSTLPFYALMEAAVNGALEKGRIRIEPLLAMGRESKLPKVEVYRELKANGIQPDETWSCYHPTEENGRECGRCRNCLEKKEDLAILEEFDEIENRHEPTV